MHPKTLFQNTQGPLEFSGGPAVRTRSFHCGAQGSIPGRRIKTPQVVGLDKTNNATKQNLEQQAGDFNSSLSKWQSTQTRELQGRQKMCTQVWPDTEHYTQQLENKTIRPKVEEDLDTCTISKNPPTDYWNPHCTPSTATMEKTGYRPFNAWSNLAPLIRNNHTLASRSATVWRTQHHLPYSLYKTLNSNQDLKPNLC